MITDERIDKLEQKIEKLQADYAVLKYVMEKESLTDQLIKITVNNTSQQLPQLIKIMRAMNVKNEEKVNED